MNESVADSGLENRVSVSDAPQRMLKLRIDFDGGCRGNPGDGYGSFDIQSKIYSMRKLRMQFGFMTNNVAEYRALRSALVTLLIAAEEPPLLEVGMKNMDLRIWSDSKLLVNQVIGRFRCLNVGMKLERDIIREHLDKFGKWQIRWNRRENNVARFGH